MVNCFVIKFCYNVSDDNFMCIITTSTFVLEQAKDMVTITDNYNFS